MRVLGYNVEATEKIYRGLCEL